MARFRVLMTVKDYPVWINPDTVVRVWDDDGVTAVMYMGGVTDHIKDMTVKEVLRRLR